MIETALKWYKAEEKIPDKGDSIVFRDLGGRYTIGTVASTIPHEFLFSVEMGNLPYYVDKNVLWAYFIPPKEKEFHVYLDKTCAVDYYSYFDTLKAINDECDIIKTTQLSLLNTSLLEKYRVFLHKGDKQIEITLGDCQGTDRNIKVTDNLEKLVMAGEFNFE